MLLVTSAAGQEFRSVDVTRDGRLTVDAREAVWVVPPRGGAARTVLDVGAPATNVRFSPDASRLLFQIGSGSHAAIWMADSDGENLVQLTDEAGGWDPVWHPSGERIAYASGDVAADLWEMDLATGLRWRLTRSEAGDQSPSWSRDGRHLIFIRREPSGWQLVLRRFGKADAVLHRSALPLAAAAWRPDGTLVTFLEDLPVAGRELKMVILSEPPLVRVLADGEAFDRTPVRWQDRQTFFYLAAGSVRRRHFGDWTSSIVPVHLPNDNFKPPPAPRIASRELPEQVVAEPPLVVRARRLFDGMGRDYINNMDILIRDGMIAEVSTQRDWGAYPVLDLGDVTVLPGLIDAYAVLPPSDPRPDGESRRGSALLSWGITTIVTQPVTMMPSANTDAPRSQTWPDDDSSPGPRVLPAATLADPADAQQAAFLVKGSIARDAEPETVIAATAAANRLRELQRPLLAGDAYSATRFDTSVVLGRGIREPTRVATTFFVAGLADGHTPGVDALWRTRQAAGTPPDQTTSARNPSIPLPLGSIAVAASADNPLPLGLSLHAELMALRAAGVANHEVLKAAGSNAARLLGLNGKLGQVSVGARADLLLVAGDPLNELEDLTNVVGVVRDGRFLSLVGLLETRPPRSSGR